MEKKNKTKRNHLNVRGDKPKRRMLRLANDFRKDFAIRALRAVSATATEDDDEENKYLKIFERSTSPHSLLHLWFIRSVLSTLPLFVTRSTLQWCSINFVTVAFVCVLNPYARTELAVLPSHTWASRHSLSTSDHSQTQTHEATREWAGIIKRQMRMTLRNFKRLLWVWQMT